MNNSDKIISIDTATSILNISLLKDGNIVSVKGEGESSNNEELASLLKKILDDNNIDINDVGTILINKGPGSFTGLRIGYAFLEGLMLSLDIKVSQICLLEAVRYVFKDVIKEDSLICQYIRKNNYFVYNVKENCLKYTESEDINNFLKETNSKAYVINNVDDEYKSFDYEFIDLTQKTLPSSVLINYYLNASVPNIKNITDLEPNYIQRISAKKISERGN